MVYKVGDHDGCGCEVVSVQVLDKKTGSFIERDKYNQLYSPYHNSKLKSKEDRLFEKRVRCSNRKIRNKVVRIIKILQEK